jgi:hypothetical protein
MKRLLEFSDNYLHREPVDFRKSINGLTLIVEHDMQLSPFSEALLIFCNKARDKLKVVYWDKMEFALWYKRLEKDKFKWTRKHKQAVISLTYEYGTCYYPALISRRCIRINLFITKPSAYRRSPSNDLLVDLRC